MGRREGFYRKSKQDREMAWGEGEGGGGGRRHAIVLCEGVANGAIFRSHLSHYSAYYDALCSVLLTLARCAFEARGGKTGGEGGLGRGSYAIAI
jgi:hypothetical protein